MIEVSVIVPVYNAINTINRCVESLIKQTLTRMEIILINDCSTDESLVIIEEWQKAFPDRIKVASTEVNLGPGGARNLGVELASGNYIGFVDSDDYIVSRMYELLLEKAKETGYDVIDSGLYDEKNDKAILFTGDECCGELTPDKRRQLMVLGGYCVTKLFRKELFIDANLRMRENCGLEDADFIAYLFGTIKSIGTVKEILYCYTNAAGSLSKPSDYKKYHYNIINAMEAIWEKMHTLDIYTQIVDAVEYEIIQMYIYGVLNAIECSFKGDRELSFEMLTQLSNIKMKTIISNKEYDNLYVRAKIGADEISLAKMNDESPRKLLSSVYKK